MTRKREFAAVIGYMNFIGIHSFFSDFNEDRPVLFMTDYIGVQRNFFHKDGFDVIRKAFIPIRIRVDIFYLINHVLLLPLRAPYPAIDSP